MIENITENLSTDIAATEPMDDAELQSIITQDLTDAVSYVDSDLSPTRAKGTEYYRGDLFGNEVEGNSKVVAMEVRDTVSAMLPSLMRVFFNSENVVEDEEQVRIEEYSGLDDQTLEMLMQEPGAEVKIITSYPDPSIDELQISTVDPVTGQPVMMPPAMVHDVQIKRITKDGRIRIMAVPPEELLLDRRARSFDDATIIAHRQMATMADLLAMGYDQDEIEENLSTTDLDSNDEYLARQPLSTTFGTNDAANPMMRRVLYIEAYSRVDYDGDGIAELRKVCCMGGGYKVVRNLPASYIPFADFPCDPEPHTSPLEAMSIFDITRDLQEIKSEILRNTLDSLAQSIHPRTAVVEGQVNIDDVLNNETGAIIRMRAPGMVQPLSTPFVGQAAFPMMEYMDQIKEDRTGMSKAAMGLNADALQSSTKAAVNATISASQGRIELTARILAEGMKKLFKGILFLTITHQDKARMVRLRNEWVQIDPRFWDATMDANINIALGNGDTNEKLQALMMIMSKQEQILQQLGPTNPLVTPQQFSNTLRKIVELSGFKDTTSYFQQIPADYVPPTPPQKPSPEEVLAQVQAESIKADIQKKAAELELKRQQMLLDDDLARDKMAQDMYLKKYEIELKYKSQISTAEIDAAQNIDREAMRQQALLAQQQAAQFVQQQQPPAPEMMPPSTFNGMAQ